MENNTQRVASDCVEWKLLGNVGVKASWFLVGSVVVLFHCGVDRFLDQRGRDLVVTFYDVGQGDSVGVKFPNGELMLVDAPGGFGKWNAGERVVLPELLRKGRLSVDYLMMSHPDSDHAAGLPPIADQLSVRNFLFHSVFGGDAITGTIRSLVADKKGQAIAIERPWSIDLGGAHMTVWPIGHSCVDHCDDNNRSLFTEIEFAGCRVLLTADGEAVAEEEWLRVSGKAIDLLKVAHHGSKTSSTKAFLTGTRPQLAVTSVGWRNRYHHPHPSVIQRYQSLGIPVLRTDVDGAVEIRVLPSGIMQCDSWHGPCGNYHCSREKPQSPLF